MVAETLAEAVVVGVGGWLWPWAVLAVAATVRLACVHCCI